MHTSLRLSLSALALSIPLLALAAPISVTGITATVQNDGIAVQWNAVSGDIANYRVFYSHESILNTGGLYDEFEHTSGTETAHILRNVPQMNDVYISVLAVDSKGAESAYFTEEAHVNMTSGPTAPTSSATSSIATPTPSSTTQQASSLSAKKVVSSSVSSVTTPAQAINDTLALLSVDVTSATGVVLHFSHIVTVDPARASEAITIITASGTKLAMKRFVIQGTNIHIDTEEQTRGAAYKTTVGVAVSAIGTSGERLTISPDQSPLLFSGHTSGKLPTSESPSSVASARSEVTQLRLRAQPTGATYRVEATWQPATGAVKGYSIAQTVDGGETFGPPQVVKADERDLIVSKVPTGSFGIRIAVLYSDDTLSKGITQNIDLPNMSDSPITGSVTQPHVGGSKTLANSGPALWLAIGATGMAAGYLHTRRKRVQALVA